MEVFRNTNIRTPRYRKESLKFYQYQKLKIISKIFLYSKKIAIKEHCSKMIFPFRIENNQIEIDFLISKLKIKHLIVILNFVA